MLTEQTGELLERSVKEARKLAAVARRRAVGRGARGLILATSTRLGNPAEDILLPDTISEMTRLGMRPREIALDGGFNLERMGDPRLQR